MSISNIEQGSGTIASGAEPQPTKSSWRRTLLVLAVGAAAGSVMLVQLESSFSRVSNLIRKI